MTQFEILTNYIPKLEGNHFGKWVVDTENDGSSERPIHMPYVDYSAIIYNFVHDFYQFENENNDLKLNYYQDILNENNIEWRSESMITADVSDLNAQAILALIMGVIRADRFSEGTLLEFFQNGCMVKWLMQLQLLDDIGD